MTLWGRTAKCDTRMDVSSALRYRKCLTDGFIQLYRKLCQHCKLV